MKTGRRLAVHRHLEALFEGESVAGLGEVQLLERFVERRDERAFAALVDRHGPMVLGVCRRLLADPLDVEDAFQATFLVLVRRAGSLKDRDRLAPWLFGVARKVASRTRTDLVRRRAREASSDRLEDVAEVEGLDVQERELGRAVVEEIGRLPGPLREPILLCCVEGLTYDEAATRLMSTGPAVRGRLARARERLRDRLTRRGFAPALGATGLLLTAEAVSAAVPSRLMTSAIQVAKTGTVPVGVDILAEGVIRAMILTKSKILAVAVVACGVAGSSMGLNAQDGPPLQAQVVTPGPDRLEQVEKKLDRLIRAIEGDARPIPARSSERTFSSDSNVPPPPAAPNPPLPPRPPIVSSDRSPFDVDAPARPMVNLPTAPSNSSSHSRMDLVEAKLQRLEARISILEQKLGSDSKSDQQPGNPFQKAGGLGP